MNGRQFVGRIAELTDNRLHDVMNGRYSGETAVLIEDHREPPVLAAEQFEQSECRRRLRYANRRHEPTLQQFTRRTGGLVDLEDVMDGDDAEDLILVDAHDR